MTVVSTLINIDFYKTTSGVRTYGTGLESRRRHYLRGCAPRKQQPRKVKNVRGAKIVARDSRGETEGGNAYLLYSARSTSRPSITKLPCRLQKRRKNRRSLSLSLSRSPYSSVSLLLSVYFSLCLSLPPLFLSLSLFPLIFPRGESCSRSGILYRERLLRAAGY